MKKQKLTVKSLKVTSFVTKAEQGTEVLGGGRSQNCNSKYPCPSWEPLCSDIYSPCVG